ncbi:MAG: iron ABC transporter permease [Paraglaciecola sp.]|uniref:FecCD family ABC transporter permease n=1 Tax=Paraglaciecola sp. TaxID=1920173 RepID=UPI0032992BAF
MSRKYSPSTILYCGLFVTFIALVISVCVGSKAISLSTTVEAFTAFSAANTDHLLVQELRLPRTFVALCSGSALAMAGLLIQTLTRNPLADPGLLGINAGASLAIVASLALFKTASVSLQMAAGFIGACVCALLIVGVGFSGNRASIARLIIAGVAFSAVFLSISQLILTSSDLLVFEQFRHWLVGTAAGRGYDVLWPLLVASLAGMMISLYLAPALNAFVLGQDISQALGVSLTRVSLLALLAITLLAGGATAAIGPIAFIGLTIPHFARRAMGNRHHFQLLFCALFGGVALVITDTLGRVIASPGEVSTGVMMALLGGPFFIYLVRHKRVTAL